MRELKFRGKRLDGEGWAYGWHLEIGGKACIRAFPTKKNPHVSLDHFIDPDTLCQSTGLKDKYGAEIYEGDEVHIWSNFYKKDRPRAEVFWNTKQVKFDTRTSSGLYHDWLPNGHHASWFIEIVGNIHENPHQRQ